MARSNDKYTTEQIGQLEEGIDPDVFALTAGCTDYQRAWFACYVGPAGLNSAEAARMCGSPATSAKVTGCNTRKIPAIDAAVSAHLRSRGIDRGRILDALGRIAFADVSEALDGNGRISLKLANQRGLGHMLEEQEFHYDGGIKKVKFRSPEKALELLGKATDGGMFTEKASVEHSGSIDTGESYDYSLLTDGELDILEPLLAKAQRTGKADAPGS